MQVKSEAGVIWEMYQHGLITLAELRNYFGFPRELKK